MMLYLCYHGETSHPKTCLCYCSSKKIFYEPHGPNYSLLLKTCIGVRCDCTEFLLHALGHVKSINELQKSVLVDTLISTCQSLECFVWVWICLATENCLYTLGTYTPAVVELVIDCSLIELQLAQAYE